MLEILNWYVRICMYDTTVYVIRLTLIRKSCQVEFYKLHCKNRGTDRTYTKANNDFDI